MSRLTAYTHSPDFPPRAICDDADALVEWFQAVFYAAAVPGPDHAEATDRERYLYGLSAEQYVAARRAGELTCEEYATALVKRARHYRAMNQWTYRSYGLLGQAIDAARELDARAAAEGVESLAPLYGLLIPMKGTAAVIDYPSGAGSGVLSGYTPVKESELTALIRARNGIIFGTTNVPEFAFSYRTGTPASGQTRNPYGVKLTVGGSSGGAGSAVAGYMCAVAVTEDTGGSTRVPATCCQNFGFDPSRNHYPNGGNPGLSYVCDQLGFNARSIDDIILLDRALCDQPDGARHAAAAQAAAARPAAAIRVGAPTCPFEVTDKATINADVRGKCAASKAALAAAGITVLEQEWPTQHCEHLGRAENVMFDAMFRERVVNGKPLAVFGGMASALGQMSQFIHEYLDAPVSAKEVIADCGRTKHGHNPGENLAQCGRGDETQFRYFLGPYIKEMCEVYNSYFEATGADLIVLPSASAATPDLDALVANAVPLTPLGGELGDATGSDGEVFHAQNNVLKFLHIPKMVVPTGLTADGRPTAVQLWGSAVPYEDMFDDACSAERDVEFLHLARRVSAAIQADPALRRVDSPFACSPPLGAKTPM